MTDKNGWKIRTTDHWKREMAMMIDAADEALVKIVNEHEICPACFAQTYALHLRDEIERGRIQHHSADTDDEPTSEPH